MHVFRFFIGVVCAALVAASPLFAADQEPAKKERGTIFTLWPLVDYRTSPAEGYRNLSLLGPIFKFQIKGDDRDTAIRPFFYISANPKEGRRSTDFLYPAASLDVTPEAFSYRAFEIYQNTIYRKDQPKEEHGVTLFPFYFSGTSEKYGPYRAVFPFYGTLYQRFWRDEYHFVLFPLYGRTVKNGTTNRHYLYPFFSTTTGDKESGFEFFPLYGRSHKEGVYSKRYVVWPFFTFNDTGLNTDNPTSKTLIFPLYAATDSPKKTARSYLWPFFGYDDDRDKKTFETDYFWPFIYTVRGETKNTTSVLPFWMKETSPGWEKKWLIWPLYRHQEMTSSMFNEEYDRYLFFLYTDRRQTWPKDGATARRTAFWPLFLYKSTPHGVSSISLPAPVEPILDKEGIERDWAPLWRIYQRRWNENGDSASSFLWNLFWHERRGEDLAYEFFPLVSYRSEKAETEFKLFKGLFGYSRSGGERELTLLWIPAGLKWGTK
ncbi:hypothetical protein [Geomesophilobacter sediminis]|uniref:Uncharacterized protein n=1 Tax=Geomesophilobacter sediminis TaxID=2798584 RepID=A0A8J7M060_9BACT|nr:hypothetical protein [Geomesophilobacter sediminis]MBJ6723492.1 hypothetical protein [Geomesophilobacter sediminis]